PDLHVKVDHAFDWNQDFHNYAFGEKIDVNVN
ncbi:MAG: hypothetical protein V7642_1504, partial [Burkholderiales bacterium]